MFLQLITNHLTNVAQNSDEETTIKQKINVGMPYLNKNWLCKNVDHVNSKGRILAKQIL